MLSQHKAEKSTWDNKFLWMIWVRVYYNSMSGYEDPTINKWKWDYRDRDLTNTYNKCLLKWQ